MTIPKIIIVTLTFKLQTIKKRNKMSLIRNADGGKNREGNEFARGKFPWPAEIPQNLLSASDKKRLRSYALNQLSQSIKKKMTKP